MGKPDNPTLIDDLVAVVCGSADGCNQDCHQNALNRVRAYHDGQDPYDNYVDGLVCRCGEHKQGKLPAELKAELAEVDQEELPERLRPLGKKKQPVAKKGGK